MPAGLLIEINVIAKGVTGLHVRMPSTEDEREIASVALVAFISECMRAENVGVFQLLEFLFTVCESLKCEFPGLAAAVRRQVIKNIKEQRDGEK
jgi:hypothetical protein